MKEMKFKQEILEMYLAGEMITTIAEKYGLNIATLRKNISRMKKRGEIPAGRRTNALPRQLKKPDTVEPETTVVEEPKSYRKTVKEMAAVWNEEPVHCNTSISKKCIWGMCQTQSLSNVSANLCNYCFATGHSRGCDWKECHRFVPITKDTPRPIIRFDGINAKGDDKWDYR